MGLWNKIVTGIAVGLLSIGAIEGQRSLDIRGLESAVNSQNSPQTPPAVPLPQPTPAPGSNTGNSPRQLQFILSLSSPQDLKVKQGDVVTVGQVLADRVEERSRLSSQRRALQLSLQQIEGATITTPPASVPVPVVNQLPPISYMEEEAAITAAQMSVQQAERAFALQQESLKNEPLEESSTVARAAVGVKNYQRLVDNQKRKIDAVALLKDLPEDVLIHEQEVLKQKEADLQQAQADFEQAQAKLSAASQAQVEKLRSLAASLEKARTDQQLAIAKLQTKKDQRAYTEYEASVTAARRAEEKNQAAQSYSLQLQEAEQQRRDRSFQLAQLRAKMSEVDDKLQSIAVVTSPYSGTIRRIKFQGQNNNELSVKLTLTVGNTGSPSPTPGNPTVPLPPSPSASTTTPLLQRSSNTSYPSHLLQILTKAVLDASSLQVKAKTLSLLNSFWLSAVQSPSVQAQETAPKPQSQTSPLPVPARPPQTQVSPPVPTPPAPKQPSPEPSEPEETEETPDAEDQEETPEEPAEEQDTPEEGAPESDSNPLNSSGDSMDAVVKLGINADLWSDMKGELPCVDATTECIAQLQQAAAVQNPLIQEIDTRIEEINSKIEEAKAANKKSVDLSVLRPAARVFIEPTFQTTNNPNEQPKQRGPIEKIFSIFTYPVGVVNEVLRAVGIPLFDKLFAGGSDQNQQRAIAISDLQVKLAEIQRGRAELADKVKEKVALAVFDFDTSRREFQVSQEIGKRESQRVQLIQVEYRFGDGDSVAYLGQLSTLDRNKASVWRSWTSMRSQLEKIKLLVLGSPE